MNTVKIIECPRDAMQGFDTPIPTQVKIDYLNKLLRVGFHTLDFGSFVSPKAVPQMADTAQVLAGLDLAGTDTQLLAIVANQRGAQDALAHPQIQYLGFPFSISETFQRRNTNKSQEEAVAEVIEIKKKTDAARRELVVYLSMAFGNPYAEPWNEQQVKVWAQIFADLGITILSLADTVGTAQPKSITNLFSELSYTLPQVEFGAHFHANPKQWHAKIDAAYKAGCRRFDGALRGYGGCPFAKDELVGNIATENILSYLDEQGVGHGTHPNMLAEALKTVPSVFPH
jgi:hydroxymethylglutaryl-CoA lyase